MKKRVSLGIILIAFATSSILARQHGIHSEGLLVERPDLQAVLTEEAEPETFSHGFLAGRAYYDTLLAQAIKRHWAVQGSVYYSFNNKGYDNCNCLCPLSGVIFGDKELEFKDFNLFSQLSFDNNINKTGSNNPVVRPGLPLDPPTFETFRSEQYGFYLACTKMRVNADQRELGAGINGTYHFNIPCFSDIAGAVGIRVPVKTVRRDMDLEFTNLKLYTEAPPVKFVDAPTDSPNNTTSTILPESAISKFNTEFDSVQDYFIRGILAPKGLTFDPHQRKSGLGDISVYGLVDFAHYFEHMDGFQLGLNVVFPSGNKRTGKKIWEVELGNGGAYQFDIFLETLFTTPSPLLNPAFSIAGEFSKRFKGIRRIPKLKKVSETTSVQNTEVLSPTQDISSFLVQPFERFDSCVLELADHAVPAKIKYGNRFIASIGNYFYNVFNCGLRLGVFYDYVYKRKDSICVDASDCECACPATDLSGTFKTELLECNSEKRMQRVGWNLTYEFHSCVEFNLGSQHVVHGRNVERRHEVFASLIGVF